MRGKTKIGLRHGVALSPHILTAHHIPQPEANVEAPVSQWRHATGHDGIGPFLSPVRQVWPGVLVRYHAGRVNCTKHPASLKVSLDNTANFLWRLRFSAKRGNGNRHLGEAYARHLNAELGKCRQCRKRSSGQQADENATSLVGSDAHKLSCIYCNWVILRGDRGSSSSSPFSARIKSVAMRCKTRFLFTDSWPRLFSRCQR